MTTGWVDFFAMEEIVDAAGRVVVRRVRVCFFTMEPLEGGAGVSPEEATGGETGARVVAGGVTGCGGVEETEEGAPEVAVRGGTGGVTLVGVGWEAIVRREDFSDRRGAAHATSDTERRNARARRMRRMEAFPYPNKLDETRQHTLMISRGGRRGRPGRCLRA